MSSELVVSLPFICDMTFGKSSLQKSCLCFFGYLKPEFTIPYADCVKDNELRTKCIDYTTWVGESSLLNKASETVSQSVTNACSSCTSLRNEKLTLR